MILSEKVFLFLQGFVAVAKQHELLANSGNLLLCCGKIPTKLVLLGADALVCAAGGGVLLLDSLHRITQRCVFEAERVPLLAGLEAQLGIFLRCGLHLIQNVTGSRSLAECLVALGDERCVVEIVQSDLAGGFLEIVLQLGDAKLYLTVALPVVPLKRAFRLRANSTVGALPRSKLLDLGLKAGDFGLQFLGLVLEHGVMIMKFADFLLELIQRDKNLLVLRCDVDIIYGAGFVACVDAAARDNLDEHWSSVPQSAKFERAGGPVWQVAEVGEEEGAGRSDGVGWLHDG